MTRRPSTRSPASISIRHVPSIPASAVPHCKAMAVRSIVEKMIIPAETLSSIEKLQLIYAPVAVAFLDAPPPGMAHVSQAEAAGCGYWKRAAEGQAFYTTAEDHMNCPVGAFTHGVTLTPEKTSELQ